MALTYLVLVVLCDEAPLLQYMHRVARKTATLLADRAGRGLIFRLSSFQVQFLDVPYLQLVQRLLISAAHELDFSGLDQDH